MQGLGLESRYLHKQRSLSALVSFVVLCTRPENGGGVLEGRDPFCGPKTRTIVFGVLLCIHTLVPLLVVSREKGNFIPI